MRWNGLWAYRNFNLKASVFARNADRAGSVYTKHSQEHSLSFSPSIVNLNGTQFSQSEVELHSDATRYIKIWRTRLRTLLRILNKDKP